MSVTFPSLGLIILDSAPGDLRCKLRYPAILFFIRKHPLRHSVKRLVMSLVGPKNHQLTAVLIRHCLVVKFVS